ncbi:hypothetical protein SAMN04488029_3513 [Reichenbachiella faecimaris]|uniref:Lipoprotein n=1 Tax=Reichenbachiella faecimaris TaxID=692418 RepID=A0A1W2GMI2_REIFA|nr:hypothetical protein [Reichenbachiella faecimaris]SMD37873.1 hypothetical protein SAMN04488029_3513 [Reichenbachiella faecimaris]
MKKLLGIFISTAAFTFYSCSDDIESVDESSATEIAIEDASLETTSSELMEEIDEAADYATNFFESTGGKILNMLGFGGKRFGDCVTITEDEAAGTMTIDFGEEGCEGRDGRIRKGKIIITHEGERDVPGFKRTITLEDFSVDTIAVEGTRVLTYVSGTDTEKEYNATLTGGKLTFPDGTIATRESTRTRIASFDEEGEKTQVERFGTATGINREGLTYANDVDETTPILTLSACREEGTYAPVSGILTINIEGESEKVIDYGDGACDNLVTITQDGVSEEVEIDPKQRRKKRFRRRKS